MKFENSVITLHSVFVSAYVGFTTGGVAATSAAAAAQGYVYGAWTTGVFSALQSAGETYSITVAQFERQEKCNLGRYKQLPLNYFLRC